MAIGKEKNVTIKDVAEKAGVSYQTVSRAINGQGEISVETRKRVMAAAKELGYRQNRLAGALRGQNSKVIGLVVSDLANSFHSEVAAGVEAEADSKGYSVILANSNEDPLRERQAVANLYERRVEGLIIAPAQGDHEYINSDLPSDFPIVAVNRRLEAGRSGAVLLRNVEAAKVAANHLIALGHTKIGAIIASQELMTSSERLIGFREAMEEAGLRVNSDWLGTGSGTIHPDGARASAMRIFSGTDRPTAVMTSSSRIAEGVLIALRELGLKRGRDADVISFDNAPWSALLDPPLPVIEQPTRHIGQAATRMLVGMIEGTGIAEELRLPGKLLTHGEQKISISV
ncbi:MAG: LacI family DNA-binding transcriptional regulator [Silicimonas sp.]|uniref:LacI family DNA-binding transcriptional regulator n=1 Tax=Roseovarius sp. TaxID=1486281 RepID=UPI0032EDD697